MSIFSCPTYLCPVPLPHIKLGIVPSNDVTGIYFIYQTKSCSVEKQKMGLYYKNTDLLLFYFGLKS